MTSSPTIIQSPTAALVRSRPRRFAPGAGLAGRRRALQVALGLIWLLDAALQYQLYMFSKPSSARSSGAAPRAIPR